MKILFTLASLIGIIYFLLKKRIPDLYTIAYFSAIIYFIPGFVGYVVYPGGAKVKIDERVYIVFLLVEIAVIFGAVVKDATDMSRNYLSNPIIKVTGTKYIAEILMIIALLVSFYEIIKVNKYLFASKRVMMPMLGRVFTLLIYSASLSFLFGFIEKKKLTTWLSLIMLIFLFLMGFRSPIALSILALILIKVRSGKKISFIIQCSKQTVAILIFGYFMIMGKIFYGTFKILGLKEAFFKLIDIDSIVIGINSIESFAIQTILNEVIVRNFSIGFSHLQDIIYQLLIIPSYFGADSQAFNIIIQTELFPGLNYGMAYNIWAEAIACGGFAFLIIVILIFVTGIAVLDRLSNIKNPIIQGTSALMGVYWSFYIHRSSIAVELTYQRHIVYALIIGFILSICLTIMIKVSKRSSKRNFRQDR